MPIPSLHLRDNEQILLVLHRHWFALARELFLVGSLLLFGITAFFSRETLYGAIDKTILAPLSVFFLLLYLLILLLFAFAVWINYRLDVWIITTRRVVDIEQRGLFNREISEFLLSSVQDITTEVPNIIATLLDFGDMTIQTAGQKNFLVREIPRMEEAKKLILEYSEKTKQELN